MTKQEIYQALADGKATSVQRHGVISKAWVTADSEQRLLGWLASDAEDFDETRYRLKPTPVPPGDLTWEEAEAAHKRGEKVEWWDDCDLSWHEKISCSFHKETAYRLAPAPKMRTVKAEELPPVFWVSFSLTDTPSLCGRVCKHRNELSLGSAWWTMDGLREAGAVYSEHHSKGPWHKFEVEEQQ